MRKQFCHLQLSQLTEVAVAIATRVVWVLQVAGGCPSNGQYAVLVCTASSPFSLGSDYCSRYILSPPAWSPMNNQPASGSNLVQVHKWVVGCLEGRALLIRSSPMGRFLGLDSPSILLKHPT